MDDKFTNDKLIENNNNNSYSFEDETIKKPTQLTSKPIIAGIMLILAGLSALLFWGSMVMSIDTIFETMDWTQFQDMNPELEIEQIKQILHTCSSIEIVLSIFPILGGILALKRSQWGISLVGGILGLFTLGFVFISPVLSLIGIILIFTSKDEFAKHLKL